MLDKIKHKHLIIDTNIIIEATRHYDEFKIFFQELKNDEIVLCIDYSITLEFLRSSNTIDILKKKIDYITLLFGSNYQELFISKETFIDARRISNLYYFIGKKGVSTIDCLLAAQAKKYEKNCYLATINNSHFSIKIFDRIGIYTIATDDKIFNIGIYKFSEVKYDELKNRFVKIKK